MSERIMIVEDEGLVALELEECLQQLGYVVPAIVASGAQAVAKAAETRPDLVLMDIRLKGKMDGIEAAQQIMNQQGIPVVYLTAYSDDATVRRATETSPFGFVLKPWEERSLQIAINMALHKADVEGAVRHQRDWYLSILRYMGAPLVVCDAQGIVRFMNSSAEQLLGSETAKSQVSLYEVLGRGSSDSPLSAIDAVMEGRTVRVGKIPLRRDAEQDTMVDLTVTPIKGGAGDEVEGFAVLMTPEGDESDQPPDRTPLPEYLQMELTRLMLLQQNSGEEEDLFVAGQLEAYRRILRDHLGVSAYDSPRNGWRTQLARSAIRDAHEQVKAVWKAQKNVTPTGTVSKEKFSRYLEVLVGRLAESHGTAKKKIAVSVLVKPEEMELDPAIYCALLVDELARYALEQAATKKSHGKISIAINEVDQSTLQLSVTHGGLAVADLPVAEEESSVLDVLTIEMGGSLTVQPAPTATWLVLFPRSSPA